METQIEVKTGRAKLVEALESLVMRVSSEWLVSADEIMSDSRGTATVAEARSVAMYHAVMGLGMTRARVGKVFAGRDHSSVCSAVGRVVCRMQEDKEFGSRVNGVGVLDANQSQNEEG